MRRATLVPGHQRREQEICLRALSEATTETGILRRLFAQKRLLEIHPPVGFVSQMHVRYSDPTAKILATHGIRPVVLVRNIFDVIVSLRDHLSDTAPYMAMAYVSEEMRSWPAEKMYSFLADMAVPWYLNFFVCWSGCDDKLLLTYEALTADPKKTLREVAAFAGIAATEADIESAISRATNSDTRKNVAVAGRGQAMLPSDIKERIAKLAAYYPDIDFSAIGLRGKQDNQLGVPALSSQ
jgi:hypothetical protein